MFRMLCYNVLGFIITIRRLDKAKNAKIFKKPLHNYIFHFKRFGVCYHRCQRFKVKDNKAETNEIPYISCVFIHTEAGMYEILCYCGISCTEKVRGRNKCNLGSNT